MPFTPAHPAIVLPLLRTRWVSATGLVIGSLSPDFEYFFRVSVRSDYSHTLPGIFYFDIPVTILIAFTFHGLVKHNLIRNLPVFFQRRFGQLLSFNFKHFFFQHWFVFLLSATIGAASHIFWDAFTHGDGFFVLQFPFIFLFRIPFEGGSYPIYYFAQHLSTVVGLLVVVLYVAGMPSENGVGFRPFVVYWITVFLIAAAFVLVRLSLDDWQLKIGHMVVSAISGICVGVILAGLVKFKEVTTNNIDGQEKSVGTGRKA